MGKDILSKIKTIASKDLNLISLMWLFYYFRKTNSEYSIKYLMEFINDYYRLQDEMPEEFYELILYHVHQENYHSLIPVFMKRSIFSLISYLKYDNEYTEFLEEEITPLQYYQTPKKQINRLIEILKSMPVSEFGSALNKTIEEELQWKLKMPPRYTEEEYVLLSYKIYLSIGLDNAIELLGKRYGNIDYEKIFYLFSRLNICSISSSEEQVIFNDFLFSNKKSSDNVMHQILGGQFKELFLNFDYFYNNFKMFLNRLGSKLPREKVCSLLKERFLSHDVVNPNITGDIFDDMLSSYYNRYDTLDTPEEEIHQKNIEIYNEFLKNKYKSSIPMINVSDDLYFCEVIKLNDPRNLVLGYRAGNCFRFNGEAAILFRNFLKSEHMRLVSISTQEYKDFAMMLVMRNGNVLIGQGIEISKWAPSSITGRALYDICRELLKKMMDYMNSNGDEIVATIIGSSNSNVSNYNNQVLPFLVNPILENSGNYYNGIYNYQCLLDLSEGHTLKDIKLYKPSIIYCDEREPILRRRKYDYSVTENYMRIEKRLIALRFYRTQATHDFSFYHELSNHTEVYTCCNTDWYITLFEDNSIDSFIHSSDERAVVEYESELAKIKESLHSKFKPFSKRKVNHKKQ